MGQTFWNPHTFIPARPSLPPRARIIPPVPSSPCTTPILFLPSALSSLVAWRGLDAVDVEPGTTGDLKLNNSEPFDRECKRVVGMGDVEAVDESKSSCRGEDADGPAVAMLRVFLSSSCFERRLGETRDTAGLVEVQESLQEII